MLVVLCPCCRALAVLSACVTCVCLVNVRPIWRGRLTFAAGPPARPRDRSAYTSTPSGRRPEPLTSAAFSRRPCFAKSAAFVTLVEFVAILAPSVSLPRVVPRLPRPSSPNRGALLRRGIPLLAIRRASARGPRTGPARLAQLDTRPLGLLLRRFPFFGWPAVSRDSGAETARSRAEERPSGERGRTRGLGGKPAKAGPPRTH